jgi:hypothetical protein
MLKFVMGMAIGFAAGYFYGSERAQEEARRRLASVPEPMRNATGFISDSISNAPLPDSVKQTATRATAAVQSATERAANAAAPSASVITPTPGEVAARPSQPLPRIEPETSGL